MANVGYATLQIIPSAKGFTTALNGQVAPGMAGVGSTSGKKFGSGMLASFKSFAGPLAAVAGTAAIGSFFKNAITGASDLNETLSASKVIFGDAQSAVEKFARDSSKNILLTVNEAVDAANTFGTFGKAAGLTGKDLSTFSTDLTGLASDLASFKNTTPEEAITALSAALRGESEPIRKYGVLLDDFSMRQEAVRLGLIKTTKTALTPQNKILAAQSLIFKSTGDAQGDAARTLGGFANQSKFLRKQLVDLRDQVGTALLPAMTKLVTLLNSGIQPAFQAIKKVAQPIVAFFKSFGSETGKSSVFAERFAGVVNTLKTYFNQIAPVVANFGNQAKNVLGPGLKQIGDIITNTVLPAIQAFVPAVTPIVKFIYTFIFKNLIGVLQAVVGVLKGVFKVVGGLLNVFAGLFTGDWSRLWKGVKQIFSGLWDAIVGIFKGLWTIMKNILGTAFKAIIGIAWNGIKLLGSAIWSGIKTIIGFWISLPGKIIEALMALPKKLFEFGVNMVQGFIDGIKSIAGNIINVIKESITDKLPEFVKNALGIQSPSKVFKEIGKNVGLGFIKGVQGTTDKIKDTFAKLAEDVKKSGNKKLIAAVADAQKKILALATKRDVLKDRYAEAKSNLADLKNEAADYAKSVRDAITATGDFSTARSFDSIVRNLSTSVAKATEFNSVITGLKNSGLNDTALSQLVQQGPAGALNAAKALLASGTVGIETVNNLQAQLKKQGSAIGDTISGSIYDAAIADAEKSVKTIAGDLTKVENQIVGVAAALAKEIAKIGKIDSPAWLKDLIGVTKYTSNTAGAPKSPALGARSDSAARGASGNDKPTVVVNNYNPVAEKTSVTVSNTLTRLAVLGIG